MKKNFLALAPILLMAAACTRPSPQELKNDVSQSLDTNEKAEKLSDWETSEHNTSKMFKRWKTTDAKPLEVCAVLLQKSGKDLALFEEEIKHAEYKNLVEPCRKELIEKIEDYWMAEKIRTQNSRLQTAPLPVGRGAFQFPDNVQKRDMSVGYKAVTGEVAQKEVVLTFDDGPHPQYTDMILKSMQEVNAKGIFFALGKNVDAYPQILKRVAANGHAIGSHSVNHKCLPAKSICARNNGRMLTYAEATGQIRGGHQSVFNALGWVDPFFRFPYGESSPELKEYLRENQIGEFYWSVDSEDWKNRTPSEMLQVTMNQVDNRQKGILLFHDIQRKTAEAMPELLKQLYFKGYSVVLLQSSNPKDRTNSKIAR